MPGPSRTGRQPPWLAAARAKSLAVRAAMPKCGARRKHDGATCVQPVAEEGKRCRYHGGRTPKGREWHKVQAPQKGAPVAKLERKLAAIERRRAEQAARLRAMTPEEKARHDAWHAARAPGGPAERKRRADAREARDLIEAALRRDEAAQRTNAPAAPVAAPPLPAPQPRTKGPAMTEKPKPRRSVNAGPGPTLTPREVLRRNLDRLRTEGLEAATEAAIQILRDPNSPAQARSAVANSVFKASGVLDSAQDALAPEKNLADMTQDELAQMLAELDRRAREKAEQLRLLEAADDDDDDDNDDDAQRRRR